MVKHIVMWRLHDEALGRTKRENLLEMKRVLEGLEGGVETVRSLEVGIHFDALRQPDVAGDASGSPQIYDIVLYTEFDDREGLNTYQDHPEHIKARDFIRQVRTLRAVVDFEV